MTFVMNPLLYPSVIKHGKQLDFHKFSDSAASKTFDYPPVHSPRFPGMSDSIRKMYSLLQGSALDPLTTSMMGNLQRILQRLFSSGEGADPNSEWQEAELYEFCKRVTFEATFKTLYGQSQNLHMDELLEDFEKFDDFFPLLMAKVPIGLLRNAKKISKKLKNFFHPNRVAEWNAPSEFIRSRTALFQQYDTLQDQDIAGDSHVHLHTSCMISNVHKQAWRDSYLDA